MFILWTISHPKTRMLSGDPNRVASDGLLKSIFKKKHAHVQRRVTEKCGKVTDEDFENLNIRIVSGYHLLPDWITKHIF